MENFKKQYKAYVVTKLREQFCYTNVMQTPKITKVTLNMGVGESKLIESAASKLERLSGQKASLTKARKSVAGFKVREGWPIGVKVTLRNDRMWEFLDRLVNIALPRVRDFRGLNPNSFDGRGNYSMGVREQIIFPEIEYEKIERGFGLNITISTTAKSDEEGSALLSALNFPFKSLNG